MASEAQINANRRNSQKSTGPKTERGKAASSQNALVHGLTSTSHFIVGEDSEKFSDMRNRLFKDFCPETTVETVLVEKMAADFWRLLRIPHFEAALLERAAEKASNDAIEQHRFRHLLTTSYPTEETSDATATDREKLGRTIEKILAQDDLLAKLSRHEAHLTKQIRGAMDLLAKLRAEKTNGHEGIEPKTNSGILG